MYQLLNIFIKKYGQVSKCYDKPDYLLNLRLDLVEEVNKLDVGGKKQLSCRTATQMKFRMEE